MSGPFFGPGPGYPLPPPLDGPVAHCLRCFVATFYGSYRVVYIIILLYGSKVNIIANLIIQIIYILVFYDFLFYFEILPWPA